MGDGEERAKLEQQIAAHGLGNTVFLAGCIPDAARLLPAFDIFILPSLKEGLPYTILEALQARIPVVATSVGGIPDMIQSGKNGLLVPPQSSSALHSALTELIRDPIKRRQFGTAGHTTVLQNFTLNTMLTHTINCYEKHQSSI